MQPKQPAIWASVTLLARKSLTCCMTIWCFEIILAIVSNSALSEERASITQRCNSKTAREIGAKDTGSVVKLETFSYSDMSDLWNTRAEIKNRACMLLIIVSRVSWWLNHFLRLASSRWIKVPKRLSISPNLSWRSPCEDWNMDLECNNSSIKYVHEHYLSI